MPNRIALTVAATLLAAPALAQQVDTVEEMATEDEAAGVHDMLARIGCTAEVVEKEGDDLFEVDDATCEIGQYDVKLDGEFNIISMTRD